MPKRAAATHGERPRNRALRLIFEYKGRTVKMISAERLEMLAPPPQALVPATGDEGSWFELRNREGRPLYRRQIHNPVHQDLEVALDDRIARVAIEKPAGRFFLIVPDLEASSRVVLKTGLVSAKPAKAKDGVPQADPPLEFELPTQQSGKKLASKKEGR